MWDGVRRTFDHLQQWLLREEVLDLRHGRCGYENREMTERHADMYKILIIEDDAVISEQVSRYLARWGYETACAEDFENILPQFVSFAPQLVLLDIGLPFYNGYYWCGEIRKVSQVPVVFVSSASDNMNIVMAMNMGGDDFIVKPFDPESVDGDGAQECDPESGGYEPAVSGDEAGAVEERIPHSAAAL